MKIISYNVNGIRAAIKKDLIDWVKAEDPDVLCIQETKSQPDQVDPEIFAELGYNAEWHSAEKKGYSGVLTLSKEKPSSSTAGIGIPKYDAGRPGLENRFSGFYTFKLLFPFRLRQRRAPCI